VIRRDTYLVPKPTLVSALAAFAVSLLVRGFVATTAEQEFKTITSSPTTGTATGTT